MIRLTVSTNMPNVPINSTVEVPGLVACRKNIIGVGDLNHV